MAKEFRIQLDQELAIYLIRLCSAEHDCLLQELDEVRESVTSEKQIKCITDPIQEQIRCINRLNAKLRHPTIIDTDTGKERELESGEILKLYPW